MTSATNPGSAAEYVNLAGNSRDGHPHGGHDHASPPMVNRRVQVKQTDHPSTDRWIVLTTIRLTPSPLFRVGVVDGLNRSTCPLRDYTTLGRARSAANKLHNQLTKETR